MAFVGSAYDWPGSNVRRSWSNTGYFTPRRGILVCTVGSRDGATVHMEILKRDGHLSSGCVIGTGQPFVCGS